MPPTKLAESQIPKSETTEPKVINISLRKRCHSEITLIEKGSKFTPTPKQNKRELKNYLQAFEENCRCLNTSAVMNNNQIVH